MSAYPECLDSSYSICKLFGGLAQYMCIPATLDNVPISLHEAIVTRMASVQQLSTVCRQCPGMQVVHCLVITSAVAVKGLCKYPTIPRTQKNMLKCQSYLISVHGDAHATPSRRNLAVHAVFVIDGNQV